MPFIPNIPQSTDIPAQSQAQILNNFGILGAIAGNVNASSDSLNANSGFNWVYLATQAANPPAGAAFPAGTIGMYSGLNAVTAKNELYINKTNQATVVQVPITASFLSVTSVPAIYSNGWTYLPSGLILKWGNNNAANGVTIITLPVAADIPVLTRIFNIQLTIEGAGAIDADTAVRLTTVTGATSFTVYASPRITTGAKAIVFSYLVIGY